MQRFEYAIVSLSLRGTSGSQVTLCGPDGQETRADKSLVLVLNDMAAQGWEVITSAGGPTVHQQYFFHWTLRRGL